MQADIDLVLDGIEKDYGLFGSSLSLNEPRQSTGMLMLDVILNRGIVPGWYTLFGPEGSCKSTAASEILISCVNFQIPILLYFDFEGSTSPEYIESMLQINGIKVPVEQIFGIRDPKTSKWVVKPNARYYTESIAERFFDYVAKLERSLPSKRLSDDKWFLIYEDNKENRAKFKEYDKNFFAKTGKLKVPTDNGNLQALVIVDSYPAMLPDEMDADETNNRMASQARMFSEQIKRIKGKLKSKRIAIVGVNQLRQRPATMFGDPSYEPGGEALRFFSDCRIKMTPRALSSVPHKTNGKGMIEEEKSVTYDGIDNYRYIHLRTIKHKFGTPNLESWLRLWISDATGRAWGFDPVHDCFEYLRMTGQIDGKRSKFVLKLDGKEVKSSIDWFDFKTLIIGEKEQKIKIFERLKVKPFSIRKFCFSQLHNGNGMDKFFETKRLASVTRPETE